MKTSAKKILSLVIVLSTLLTCIIIPSQVVATAADYVETDFGEGKFLITTVDSDGTKYYLPTDAATSSGPKKVSFTDVNDIDEKHLWTVTSDGSGKYFIQNNAGQYLYTTSSNSGVRVSSTSGTWEYDASANSLKYTSTSRYLGVYVTGSDWRCYTSVSQANYKGTSTAFVFYKINASAPSVSVSGDSYLRAGNNITLSAVLANVSGDVVWTSSNPEVATVEGGVVTGKGIGKTTITANVNGTIGTKDIIVYPALGEISIADALTVCELTGTSNAPFEYSVVGIIESIDTAYDSDFNNITVTIGDGTNSIKAYRMTGGSDLEVGTQITVTGTLVTYGTTPEFIAGCTYTVVTDENIEAIRAAIKEIATKMSLAYQYEASLEDVVVPSTEEFEDTVNRELTEVSGTSYKEWSGKTISSSAVYAGNSAGGQSTYVSIQLRSSSNNSGIVSTTSGGKIKSITVSWNGQTSDGRTLDIYASNNPYTAASDLYGANAGTKVTSFKYTKGTTTTSTYTFSDDYAYIGIRSASGALYLDSVSIVWESKGTGEGTTEQQMVYKNSQFAFRFGVDAAIEDIANVDAYGIKVSAGEKEMFYTPDNVKVWGNDGEYSYVTVNLGDIITDLNKLNTEFTVTAYVEVDGMKYYSEQTTTYSVVSMIAYYLDNLGIEEVTHLYDYLANNDLI